MYEIRSERGKEECWECESEGDEFHSLGCMFDRREERRHSVFGTEVFFLSGRFLPLWIAKLGSQGNKLSFCKEC